MKAYIIKEGNRWTVIVFDQYGRKHAEWSCPTKESAENRAYLETHH